MKIRPGYIDFPLLDSVPDTPGSGFYVYGLESDDELYSKNTSGTVNRLSNSGNQIELFPLQFLTTGALDLSINNIPDVEGFHDLILELYFQCRDVANETMYLQINGDNRAGAYYAVGMWNTSTVSGSSSDSHHQGNPTVLAPMNWFGGTSTFSGSNGNAPKVLRARISGYNDVDRYKHVWYDLITDFDTVSAEVFGSGQWTVTTDKITSLRFLSNTVGRTAGPTFTGFRLLAQ